MFTTNGPLSVNCIHYYTRLLEGKGLVLYFDLNPIQPKCFLQLLQMQTACSCNNSYGNGNSLRFFLRGELL